MGPNSPDHPLYVRFPTKRRILDLAQCRTVPIVVIDTGWLLLFIAANTRLRVHGFVADDATDSDAFESVTCTACTRVHLVNPATGKVLGEMHDNDDDEWAAAGRNRPGDELNRSIHIHQSFRAVADDPNTSYGLPCS